MKLQLAVSPYFKERTRPGFGNEISNEHGTVSVLTNGPYSPATHSITEFVVNEDSRGMGHGKALIAEVIKRYKEDIGGQVSSIASLHVFYGMGFRPFMELHASLQHTVAMFRENGGSLYMVYKPKGDDEALASGLPSRYQIGDLVFFHPNLWMVAEGILTINVLSPAVITKITFDAPKVLYDLAMLTVNGDENGNLELAFYDAYPVERVDSTFVTDGTTYLQDVDRAERIRNQEADNYGTTAVVIYQKQLARLRAAAYRFMEREAGVIAQSFAATAMTEDHLNEVAQSLRELPALRDHAGEVTFGSDRNTVNVLVNNGDSSIAMRIEDWGQHPLINDVVIHYEVDAGKQQLRHFKRVPRDSVVNNVALLIGRYLGWDRSGR